MPSRAAVESCCCNLINLRKVLSFASNVVAILSEIVAKNARCSTSKAIPELISSFTLFTISDCFIYGETPTDPVIVSLRRVQYDLAPVIVTFVLFLEPCNLVSTAVCISAIESILESSCLA